MYDSFWSLQVHEESVRWVAARAGRGEWEDWDGWDGRRGVFTNHTVPVPAVPHTHTLAENKETCAWIYRREQQKRKNENEVGIGVDLLLSF